MRRSVTAPLLAALTSCALVLALVPALAQSPTTAQAVLPKEHLTVVSKDGQHHEFDVEVATTEQQQETGLMFRPAVPADGGMLFVWPGVQQSNMWMKNTLVPLDMVFIDRDGTIHHIAEDTVPRSLAVIDSDGPVAATLELQGGITQKLDIRVGDKVVARQFGGS